MIPGASMRETCASSVDSKFLYVGHGQSSLKGDYHIGIRQGIDRDSTGIVLGSYRDYMGIT